MISARGRQRALLYRFDSGRRRSRVSPANQLGHGLLLAFDFDLHRAVGHVSHPTAEVQSLRFVQGALAKEDALHASDDDEVASDGAHAAMVVPPRRFGFVLESD